MNGFQKIVSTYTADWYTNELTEIVTSCVKPTRVQTKWGPIPNQEAVYNWYPLAKEKSVVSNGVFLDILTTLIPRSSWPMQN